MVLLTTLRLFFLWNARSRSSQSTAAAELPYQFTRCSRHAQVNRDNRAGAYLTGEPGPVPATLVDRVYQEPVEHGQYQQRHAYERDYAKPVVRLLVYVVSAQFGAALLELPRHRVDGYVPFVRRGGRARDAEQRDHQDDALGPGFGAQYAAAERMAHGYVPFDGERHGQQHRRVTCEPQRVFILCTGRVPAGRTIDGFSSSRGTHAWSENKGGLGRKAQDTCTVCLRNRFSFRSEY